MVYKLHYLFKFIGCITLLTHVVFQGFLVNWDIQKNVWDYIFSKDCCYGSFSEMPLIVTEPYFNFTSIQEAMSEIFFEEYDCQSLLRINGVYCLE